VTDQVVDHQALAAAIRRWPRQEAVWWRRLLEVSPDEALLVAGVAHRFGAYPVTDPLERQAELDEQHQLNPGMRDRPRPGALRQAPLEARALLARMHHEETADAA
jgi:hypothetical protein